MTRWTEEEVGQYLRKFKGQGRVAISSPDLEPDSSNAASPKDAGQKMDSKFRIAIHSRRRRLCDSDGLCAKFVIDGLTEGGILPDDNAKIVSGVSYSQEKSKIEETIIEVWGVGASQRRQT